MAVKIGDRSYGTAKPRDLDGALAAQGTNAAEVAAGLGTSAGNLARALLPHLSEPVPLADLARAIADADDGAGIRAQVAKLYEAPEPKAEKAA